MSPIAIAAIIMLVLLFLNVPVFASVLGACVTYFVLNPSAGLDGMLAMQRVISGMQSVPMLAIPFFVTAGALMNYCGITDRMLKFCKVLTGHMYGGLGQVNIVLSTLMGGMSGSSLADAAMEAKLLVPDMRKAGYPNGYASAITDYLRKCNRNFYRPPVCGRYCSCCHPLRGDDDNCIKIFQETWHSAP